MTQMKPVVFRYKPIRRLLAPIITIGVKIGGIWYPVEVYVVNRIVNRNGTANLHR